MDKDEEKQGFFTKIKCRLARFGLVTVISWAVMMIILIATNCTNVGGSVLSLWMFFPAIALAVYAAALFEIGWSLAAHFTKKALLKEQNQPLEEEGKHD